MDNSHPYLIGTTITGVFCSESTGKPQPIESTVIQSFEPFTLSVVLVVSITSPLDTLPHVAVLKLYDRRFSHQLRDDRGAKPWDPSTEQAMHEFNSQPHPKLVAHGRNNSYWTHDYDEEDPNDLRNPDLWVPGHREAYLQVCCEGIRKSEVAVYRHLQDLQGKLVPQLYGTVSCTVLGTEVDGILLQYIGPPAFKLREVTQRVGPERWNEIGKAAVQLVLDISDSGVLNYDVRSDNIMVVDTPAPDGDDTPHGNTDPLLGDGKTTAPHLFMIDFGNTRLRRKCEDDVQWNKARKSEQEEEAIGYACKRLMGDNFTFVPTWRLFLEDDDPEEMYEEMWDSDEEC
jgi:hypothetical protein